MNAFNIKAHITHNLLNILGFRTRRKLVVIESDDWGSIRMASNDAYLYFLKKGYSVDQWPYDRNDALECNEDLEKLFEVLSSVKDINGNYAIITANCVVANPDFIKIKDNYFRKYFYEPFTETLKRYPSHDRVYSLYKEGIQNKIFKPQFHGREHLNVISWMKDLQENNQIVHEIFDKKMFSVNTINPNVNYLEALNYTDPNELEFQKRLIIDGCKIFKSLFGYSSKTFIAPCYIWSSSLNKTLLNCGVNYFQGLWYQFDPKRNKKNKCKRIFHYTGQSNEFAQKYLVRNVFFEPSQIDGVDWINDAISRMRIIFRWGKPAIIGTHRLNFIGFINPDNRDRNLHLFALLLKEIIKKWPDVEFISSDQLGDLM